MKNVICSGFELDCNIMTGVSNVLHTDMDNTMNVVMLI